jgi:hypothetical protein
MRRQATLTLAFMSLAACNRQSADEQDWSRIKPDVTSIGDSAAVRQHLTTFPKCTHVSLADQLFVRRCADDSPVACTEYLYLFPKRENATYVKAKQEEWDRRAVADLQPLNAMIKELKAAARLRAGSNKRTKASIRAAREDYPGAICAKSADFVGRYCPAATSAIPGDTRCKSVAELQRIAKDSLGNSLCYAHPYDRTIPDYQLNGTKEFTDRLNSTSKLLDQVRRLSDL